MASNGTVQRDDEPLEADLTFREQADGRKVSRLPGGKVVLVDLNEMDRVQDGDRWHVRLRHRDTFAIAEPVARVKDFVNPLLSPDLASVLSKTLTLAPRSPSGPENDQSGAAPPATVSSASLPAITTPPALGEPAPPPRALAPAIVAPAAAAVIAPPPASPTRAPGASPPVTSTSDPSRVVRPTDRVALFVDGANMDGACRSAGYFVDYKKARDFVLASGTFNAAYYYVADFSASDPLQQRFLDFLSHAGYIVRRRPVKVINDHETGERIIKGNLDTEMVLDMVNTVSNYDVAFLFSGDSDFERAVELLRSRGKRIYVVTSRASLSRELLHVADKPIFFLEDFRSGLLRERPAAPIAAPPS